MFPCNLRREDALVGPDLASRLRLNHHDAAGSSMSSPIEGVNPFWSPGIVSTSKEEKAISATANRPLSTFERVITGTPPILESLLAQLPTVSILDLFHTSSHLRKFLRSYPLAWKTLSFRLPQPISIPGSHGAETPDGRGGHEKYHPLNDLLLDIILPFATRLKSLDLCNTAISGADLFCEVMYPMRDTIQHLSVRGCKDVSIKYHIVPFLRRSRRKGNLALQSLYTYRCRHHRRRPYLPSSLIRRDSDSEPTHELIELCHQMGIWTDTAWCPTPGGRCFRRKDYHGNRAAPGTLEVWVPFDRLWRSGNRIGPSDGSSRSRRSDGRLWEEEEYGYDGEPLGTENGLTLGEGKDVPAHLRKSHRTFVDDIGCDQCGEIILERCETCSIRMHCMGCRKTLCASCAFDRPLPKKRRKVHNFDELVAGITGVSSFATAPSTPNSSQGLSQTAQRGERPKKTRFWWAPGASRSPNLMNEQPAPDDSSDSDDLGSTASTMGQIVPNTPPKLNMHWCCLEPIFSGGGGVAFLGPQLGGAGSDRIRAVPLPRLKQYEDPDFAHSLIIPDAVREMKNLYLYESIMGENIDIFPYLQQESLELQANTCPRSLCKDCYRSFRWKVACRACRKPLCKEHDFRALKVRKCGFRDLNIERDYVRNPPPPPLQPLRLKELRIPAFGEKRARAEPEAYSAPTPDLDEDLESAPMDRDESVTSNVGSIAHLAPPFAPERVDKDFNAVTSAADMRASPVTGRSPSRMRSISLSGLDERLGSPAAGVERLPLPCSSQHPVQWQGCGYYFCPQMRPVGDCRGRCSPGMKECAECGVFVCEFCLTDTHPCECAFCSSTYHCPVCVTKPSIKEQCTREDDLRRLEEERRQETKRKEQEREEWKALNELAEYIADFFVGIGEES